MLRQTALRYAREISQRIHSINGLIATPGMDSEAVRIRRVWVFGSTVKGKQNPNDLDLLIDIQEAGRRRIPGKRRGKEYGGKNTLRDGKLDKRYLKSYGMTTAKSATDYALMWLTKGMRMVSRHTLMHEAAAPFQEQVLIYPRWDMQE